MTQVLAGAAALVASFVGLWFSLPVDGQMRSFAKGGGDIWIAIAIAAGVGLGIGLLISGMTELAN